MKQADMRDPVYLVLHGYTVEQAANILGWGTTQVRRVLRARRFRLKFQLERLNAALGE